MNGRRRLGTLGSLALLASFAWAEAPRFQGLGNYQLAITTASPEAQRLFDQGLAFLQAFNHDEAIRSFQEAVRSDPGCAMAHWGIAMACGPHINNPAVSEARATLAWNELILANKHAHSASPLEQALIEALGHRFVQPPSPPDRRPLDLAYADAMQKVWETHPQSPDAGAFYAEARMNLRPWDLWLHDGTPQPGTTEIVSVLEAVLRLTPEHPLGNHLYIHAVEASPWPERAAAAADRLRTLQPGLGHHTHMPSHIDVLRGRWHEAIEANARAIRADAEYRLASSQKPDFYQLYMAHNRHMLAYAALMTGQSELALTQVRAMIAEMPENWLQQNALFADAFAAMPYEVLARFGRWESILAEPQPPDFLPFSRALHHATRGVALAAMDRPAEARREQAEFVHAKEAVPPTWVAGNNPCSAVLALVTPMLEGEILYREGRIDDGLAELRQAVAREDALRYDEPPGWILPVRHALGAALTQERRFVEAEEVYREDLRRRPENGWSLFGLAQSLAMQGREAEAKPVWDRFHRIWSVADVQIRSSCLCQPGLAGTTPASRAGGGLHAE